MDNLKTRVLAGETLHIFRVRCSGASGSPHATPQLWHFCGPSGDAKNEARLRKISRRPTRHSKLSLWPERTRKESQKQHSYHTNKPIRCIGVPKMRLHKVWPFRGQSGDSENAKTPLCNSWRHGFARSRRDQTICVARGGDSSSGFLFREAVSDLRRPGSAH